MSDQAPPGDRRSSFKAFFKRLLGQASDEPKRGEPSPAGPEAQPATPPVSLMRAGRPLPRPEDRPKIEARIRRMVHRWPEVSGYHLNPDPEVVEGIVQGLVRSELMHGYSYCP